MVVVVQRKDRLVLEERAFGLGTRLLTPVYRSLVFSPSHAYMQVYTELCNYRHVALSVSHK